MSQPWMKFFPSDWRADPALRMCSMAARGLWIEMLCIMQEATRCGSLTINGKALTVRQLATVSGSSVEETESLLSELEETGVFSRDDDGTIFSRRMRRDVEKAARDRNNGKSGGNPSLLNRVNPPDNRRDKGDDKAQKPEARSQSPNEILPSPTISEGEERDILFEEFWKNFPKGPLASKPKTKIAWNELGFPKDCRLALDYIPAFKGAKTTNPMSPERYLRDRIFDNLALGPRVVSSMIRVERETPQGEAWDSNYRATKGKPPPWSNGAWHFPTEWPPPFPALAHP